MSTDPSEEAGVGQRITGLGGIVNINIERKHIINYNNGAQRLELFVDLTRLPTLF